MQKEFVEIHEHIVALRKKDMPNAWGMLQKTLRSNYADLMRSGFKKDDGFRTLDVNLRFNIESPLVLSIECKRICAQRMIRTLINTNEAELSVHSSNGKPQSFAASLVPGLWLTDGEMQGPGIDIASAFDELKTLNTSNQFFNADGFGEIWEVQEGKKPMKYTPESSMVGTYVSDSAGTLRFFEVHTNDKKDLLRIWRRCSTRKP